MPAVVEYTWAPGAVAVNTATALPATFPKFDRAVGATNQTEASGGTASTTSPAEMTVTNGTSAPASGQNLTVDPVGRTFQTGVAFTAGTVLTLKVFLKGTSSVLV